MPKKKSFTKENKDLKALKSKADKAISKGLEPKDVQKFLAAAELAIKDEKKGDFTKNFNKAKSIVNKFTKEEEKLEKFRKKLGELHSQMNLLALKHSDQKFDNVSKKLETINKTIGAREVRKLNKLIKDTEKLIKNENKRLEAEAGIEEAQAVVDEAAAQNAFISKARGQITRAKNALKKKAYPTVLKHCRMAKKMADQEVKKIKKIMAQEDIRTINNFINSSKEFNIELEEPLTMIKEAKALMKKKEYEEASEMARLAEELTRRLIEEFEKVKGTQRYKEVEKAVLSIEDRVAFLESRDVDVKDYRERLTKLSDMMFSNELDEAEKEIESLDDEVFKKVEAVKSEDISKAALDSISYSAAYLMETQEFGVDVGAAQQFLDEAEEAFEEGEYERSKELAKEAKKQADVLKYNFFDKFPKKILADAEKILSTLKDQDIDLDEAEGFIEKAKKLLKEKKYESGKRYAKKAIDTAKEAHHTYINEVTTQQIIETQSALEDIKAIGLDISEAEGMLNKAQEMLFDDEEFVHAQEYALRAKTMAEKKLQSDYVRNSTQNSIKATRAQLMDLRAEGIDVSELESQISQAEEMLGRENYIVAMDMVSQAKDRSMELQRKYIVESVQGNLSQTQSMIRESQDLGIDISEVESILGEAQDLFQSDDYNAAKELSSKALGALENARQDHFSNLAQDTLHSSKFIIAEAKGSGIDVGDAQKMLSQAESMLEQNDYEKAYQLAQDAENLTKRSWETYRNQSTINAVEEVHSLLVDTSQLEGLDLGEATQILKRAEDKISMKDYDTALELASEAEDLILHQRESFATEVLPTSIVNIRSQIHNLEGYGIETDEIKALMSEAENMFKEEEFGTAQRNLRVANEQLAKVERGYFQEKVPDMIKEADALMADAGDMGLNLDDVRPMLLEAEELFKGEQYMEAHSRLDELFKVTNNTRRKYLSATLGSDIGATYSIVEDMKDAGMDMGSVEGMLQEAEAMFREKDYTAAQDKFTQANENIRSRETEFYSMQIPMMMNQAKDLRQEADTMGLDLGDVNGLLGEAESLFREQDYRQAHQKLKDAFQIADTKKRDYYVNELPNQLGSSHSMVDEMRDLGMDMGEVEMMLNEAESLFSQDDVLGAQQVYQQAMEKQQVYLADYLPNDLSQVHSLLDEAVEYGMDVNDAQAMLSEAETLFNQNDYVGAKRHLEQARQITVSRREEHVGQMANSAISSTRTLIEEAAGRGANVDSALDLLEKAEAALAHEDYENIQVFVKKATEEANTALQDSKKANMDRQRKVLLDSLTEGQQFLDEAEEEGGEGIDEIQTLIDNAAGILSSENLTEADLERATDLVSRAREETYRSKETSKYKVAKEAVESSRTLISSVKGYGIDTKEADDILNEWEEAIEKGDFSKNDRFSAAIQDTINRLRKPFQTRQVSASIQSIKAELAEAKNYGMDVSTPMNMLQEAELAFEGGNIEQADKLASESEQTLMTLRQNFRREQIIKDMEAAKKALSDAEDAGADLSEVEPILDRVQENLDRDEYDVAEASMKEAQDLIEEKGRAYASVMSQKNIEEALTEMKELKEMGADTSGLQQILTSAQDFFIKQSFSQANQFALNAKEMAKELRDDVEKQDIQKRIDKCIEEMKYLEGFNANVTEVKVHVDNATQSFNDGMYDLARETIKIGEDTLAQIRLPYLNKIATDTVSKAIIEIRNANQAGVPIPQPRADLQKAQSALNDKNFQKAYELSSSALQGALKALESQKHDQALVKIKEMESTIMDLRATGVEVKYAEAILRKAEVSFDQKDYNAVESHLKKAEDSLKESQERSAQHRTESEMSYTNSLIKYIKQNIKGTQVEIKKADMFMDKANGLVAKGKYSAAGTMAQRARQVIETMKHPNLSQFLFVFRQLQAVELVSQAKEEFTRIKRENPSVDLTPAEEMVKMAEQAFENEESFDDAKEMLLQAKIMAMEIERSVVEVNLNNELAMINSRILGLKKEGIDLSGPTKDYQTAQLAFNNKDFKKAMIFIKRAKQALGLG